MFEENDGIDEIEALQYGMHHDIVKNMAAEVIEKYFEGKEEDVSDIGGVQRGNENEKQDGLDGEGVDKD